MQESLSPHSIERAAWLDLPDPGLQESWRKRNEYPDLMDGAYFGLNGDSIMDTEGRVHVGQRGLILGHNPGLRKISIFLPTIFTGRVIAVLDSGGVPEKEISFPEAENNGWIQEMEYLPAWRYLKKNSMTMGMRSGAAQKSITDTVYQVTRIGVGKITITDRYIQRPNILYFFGLRPRI